MPHKSSRKDFIKKACLTSACLCGFGKLAIGQGVNKSLRHEFDENINKSSIYTRWIASVLENLPESLTEKEIKILIKKTSGVHYSELNMENVLKEFEGDINKFIFFLENNWGWKVSNNANARKIIANENKELCVCPLIDSRIKGVSAMCYCSEGFAEKMFSKVIGKKVEAIVISSVRRGDKSCMYEINY